MALDLRLLGGKLSKYREQFEVSVAEVAAATGISEADLAALETGTRQPTGDEILILADYFKCDYKFFISNERLASFEQTETLFRMHGTAFSKDDRWAVQEFLFLCECEDYLMGLATIRPRTEFTFDKEGRYYKGHAEAGARALREHLGYSVNEVGRNVYADFRQIGVHVFRRLLGNSSISGLCVRHPTVGKCVLVNYSEDVYRQRFSVAHEAAHAIFDDDKDVVVSFSTWSKSDLSEVRADTFASQYLMPPEFLRRIPHKERWTRDMALQWANRLQVNTEPLAYALSAAGLISPEAETLIRSAKVPREDKQDPELPISLSPNSRRRREELLHRGLSEFYVRLCFDAYEAGHVSSGRLVEMLLLDGHHQLAEVASLYGRVLRYGS